MKDFTKLYLKIYLILHILFLMLSLIVLRRTTINYSFIRLEIGAFIVTLIVTFAVWMFRLEKGNSIINTIIGYIIIIPAIYALRNIFGQYLFKFSWLIYIVMVFVGIIYGVAVWVVSRKYKKEADDLNHMLHSDKKNNS